MDALQTDVDETSYLIIGTQISLIQMGTTSYLNIATRNTQMSLIWMRTGYLNLGARNTQMSLIGMGD